MIPDDDFPKANKNKFTGESGVNLVSSLINNELKSAL